MSEKGLSTSFDCVWPLFLALRVYFNFTNSKTKIAHTPTVIGN